MNEVHKIYEGNIVYRDGRVLDAHSSVTLIRTGDVDIIVDTSDGPARGAISDSLRALGMTSEGIDIVILTHTHGDHVGNLDMFTGARVMAHREECPIEDAEAIRDGDMIADGVRVIHTPGHTRGSISIVVEAGETWVIAGDALPTKNNYIRWVPPGLNHDPELALRSMARIVSIADVIVPGHGPPFDVRHTKGGPI